MPAEQTYTKSCGKAKKKRKTKRQATSPLSDNSEPSDVNTAHGVNTGELKTGQLKRCKQDSKLVSIEGFYTNFYPNYTYCTSEMAFQAPNVPGFSMSSLPSQSFVQSPPPSQFGYQTPPPPWATKMLEDIEQIKQKLGSIDKIEKTVNMINTKLSELETKMRSLDSRLVDNEKACEFISNTNDQNKKELQKSKTI